LGKPGKIKAQPNAQVSFENVRKHSKTFENIRKYSKNDVKRSKIFENIRLFETPLRKWLKSPP